MRDADIRRALLKEMNARHGGEPDTLIIEELGLCQGIARVDLAVVNGSVHGYEIKSERDTLDRLPAQSAVYSMTLEFVTLIAAPAHLEKVQELIPQWWGIWSAAHKKGAISLSVKRQAARNPNLIPFALAQFLWRDEALQVLIDHNLSTGMKSKSRKELWARVSTSFTLEELGDIVRKCLKSRGEAWRVPSLQV
jgi:hypothetical protein